MRKAQFFKYWAVRYGVIHPCLIIIFLHYFMHNSDAWKVEEPVTQTLEAPLEKSSCFEAMLDRSGEKR